MALLFTVERQIAGNKDYIRFVRSFEPIKNRAVNILCLRKAFLLKTHKFVIFLAACAERVFKKVRIGDKIKIQFMHNSSPGRLFVFGG